MAIPRVIGGALKFGGRTFSVFGTPSRYKASQVQLNTNSGNPSKPIVAKTTPEQISNLSKTQR